MKAEKKNISRIKSFGTTTLTCTLVESCLTILKNLSKKFTRDYKVSIFLKLNY